MTFDIIVDNKFVPFDIWASQAQLIPSPCSVLTLAHKFPGFSHLSHCSHCDSTKKKQAENSHIIIF